jgi:alkylation response protein AidB-like acyl-CoA dehydrogenase
LALQTLRALGADGSELAGRIERGEIRATLAAAEKSGSWDPALVQTRAVPQTADWKLTGAKHFVPDAGGADVILVVARSVAGPTLFTVATDVAGVQVTALDTLDPGRELFTVELDDAQATLVGREGRGGVLMRRSIDLAMTALAGEQIGLLERAIAILVRHDRWPADELVQTVLDHAAAHALWTHALDPDADDAAATMAHIACSDSSVRAARLAAEIADDGETATLLHRALSASLLLGGPAVYYERLLDRLGI